jgi:hypothetical protein
VRGRALHWARRHLLPTEEAWGRIRGGVGVWACSWLEDRKGWWCGLLVSAGRPRHERALGMACSPSVSVGGTGCWVCTLQGGQPANRPAPLHVAWAQKVADAAALRQLKAATLKYTKVSPCPRPMSARLIQCAHPPAAA